MNASKCLFCATRQSLWRHVEERGHAAGRRRQSTFAALKEKGLIPSPVASDPTLWKRWRIQPSGDGLRADAHLLHDHASEGIAHSSPRSKIFSLRNQIGARLQPRLPDVLLLMRG